MTWLEICGENDDCSGCCPYGNNGETVGCKEKLMTDALVLLKEQEAKETCCKDCEYYGNCHS